MDDRDFLSYFTQLGSPKPELIMQASRNIVTTLLALDTSKVRKSSADAKDTKEEKKVKAKVADSLRKKYSQGDLGEKVNADLNYSLKRLIGGICSENHAVKQGFFLASVMVFNRFSNLVEFEKLMNLIMEETKTNSGMKNPEIHSACMGRVMCTSALIESNWPLSKQ
jgi:hypothetical protein